MNKRKVLELLKPKAKALGFSRKELARVANVILDSLPEDLEEADEESEVSRKIDEYLPLLQVSQSAATRMAGTRTRSTRDDEPDEDPDDEADDELDDEPTRTRSTRDDEFADAPRWAKRLAKMFEQNSDSSIKRRAKVEALVDGMGRMGKHYLRDFDRHTFRNNEEWEEYFADLKDEIHEIVREKNDEALEGMTKPAMAVEGRRTRRKDDDELMSDEEVIKFAKGEL